MTRNMTPIPARASPWWFHWIVWALVICALLFAAKGMGLPV